MLLLVLAFDLKDIPWAGIGAILLGLGSMLSGLATFYTATHPKDHEGEHHESEPEASDVHS